MQQEWKGKTVCLCWFVILERADEAISAHDNEDERQKATGRPGINGHNS